MNDGMSVWIRKVVFILRGCSGNHSCLFYTTLEAEVPYQQHLFYYEPGNIGEISVLQWVWGASLNLEFKALFPLHPQGLLSDSRRHRKV